MKKLVIFLSLLLFIPMMVIADAASPVFNSYHAVVSNPNGADYYDSYDLKNKVGHLDYNTDLGIVTEENNIVDFGIEKDGKFISGHMKKSDTKTANAEELPENTISNTKVKILIKSGVKMYKGPSTEYDMVGSTIPFNSEVIATGESLNWLYVTYNGQKGWINQVVPFGEYNYKPTCGIIGSESLLTISGNYTSIESNQVVEVPHSLIFKSSEYFNTYVGRALLYNGEYVFIENRGEVVIHIEKNDYPVEYVTGNNYLEHSYDYINEENKKEKNVNRYDLKGYSLDLVSDVDKLTPVVKIPNGTKLKSDYFACDPESCYMYTEYNGIKGFYIVNTAYGEDVGKGLKTIDHGEVPEEINNKEEKTEEIEEKKEEETKIEENVNDKKLSNREIIFLCGLGCVLLAVIAILIVVIINNGKKKKDVKKNDNKEEKENDNDTKKEE